eukprot:5334917-Prymnesium_polylepis.1
MPRACEHSAGRRGVRCPFGACARAPRDRSWTGWDEARAVRAGRGFVDRRLLTAQSCCAFRACDAVRWRCCARNASPASERCGIAEPSTHRLVSFERVPGSAWVADVQVPRVCDLICERTISGRGRVVARGVSCSALCNSAWVRLWSHLDNSSEPDSLRLPLLPHTPGGAHPVM